MTGDPLGERLAELVQSASRDIVICAPFIKRQALRRALAGKREETRLTVFSRWRPEEVAAGVSDPEVLLDVEARGGAMLLCDRLHAKLYRADAQILVGSANVTGAGLGWSPLSNLEILIDGSHDSEDLVAFERRLRAESVAATQSTMRDVIDAAQLLEVAPPAPVDAPEDQKAWLPHLRMPEDLFAAYSRGPEYLTQASGFAAIKDLAELDLPRGLNKDSFTAVVRTRLMQHRSLAELDEYLATPRRFGEVRALVQERYEVTKDEAEARWQATMRWLLFFFPHRYKRAVPRHSEIIVRMESDE